MEMVKQRLLNELCSICNNQEPRYRCPRCSTRTCSLPCYKRHQQWSQCTGKRDPGAYVKKSQLATPAGIDRDYNFLSGLERAVDSAERIVADRGLGGGGDSDRHGFSRSSNLRKQLERTGVTVDRAPAGMSRQKRNQTRWSKRWKEIVWTVEWVYGDGSPAFKECRESTSLSEAYAEILAQQERRRKKRKLDDDATESWPHQAQSTRGSQLTSPQAVPAGGRKTIEGNQLKWLPDQEDSDQTQELPQTTQQSPNTEARGSAKDTAIPPAHIEKEQSSHTLVSVPSSTTADLKPTEPTPAGDVDCLKHAHSQDTALPIDPTAPHFYLLKPHTSTSSRVLIPLSPSDTLCTCLRDRVVLEFPTLYVLPTPASALPDGFMLEEDYLKQSMAEAQELDELLAQAGPAVAQVEAADEREAEDERAREQEGRRIFEVLKMDITSA